MARNGRHELRTALAIIVGNAELLAEHERINDHQLLVAQVSAVVRSANRLARLVDDVMTLSAFESSAHPSKRELVEMREVVERANREVTGDGRATSPALKLPDYPVEVRGGSAQLQRAVRCLIDNAIKFTADTGRVDVELQHTHGLARLDVVDSGCGIARNDLEMIFTRFYRSASNDRSVLPGAGLGLAIVDQIVRHHGGQVTVTSREGRGSTFRVLLPAVDRRCLGPMG
jgi:two-component system phosphate regulon sensor histidine kinase PhoR